MNREREAQGEPAFANPRNAASGTLKMQNSSQVAQRPLDCLFYYLPGEQLLFETQHGSLEEAKKWGFQVPGYNRLASSMEEVFEFIDRWATEREKLPFEIDGVVIKVDSVHLQQQLGFTADFRVAGNTCRLGKTGKLAVDSRGKRGLVRSVTDAG